MPLDISRILKGILAQYTLPLNGDRGVGHWARVMENGLRLAAVGSNAVLRWPQCKDAIACVVSASLPPQLGERRLWSSPSFCSPAVCRLFS